MARAETIAKLHRTGEHVRNSEAQPEPGKLDNLSTPPAAAPRAREVRWRFRREEVQTSYSLDASTLMSAMPPFAPVNQDLRFAHLAQREQAERRLQQYTRRMDRRFDLRAAPWLGQWRGRGGSSSLAAI